MELADIKTEEDVAKVIREFYNVAAKDATIGHFFDNIDWEHHFPRMIGFWSFILLDKEGYKGNVLEKHMHLDLHQPHFDVWLSIFINTIDNNFAGEKAELAKQRARIMAFTFKSKFPEKLF
jgi:hemoglobin